MKVTKKNLGLRTITFLPKLFFTLIWMIIYGILITIRWWRFGSQELYFGDGFGRAEIAELIEKVETLTKENAEKKES